MVQPEVITSAANPLLKQVRRSVARGELTPDGCLVAETPHLLAEARSSGCEVRAVFTTAAARVELPPGIRRIELSEPLFRSIAATEAPQGVLALVRPPAWRIQDLFAAPALVLVLDGVQDPGNAGAMLRSAEAFGATGAMFVQGCASPYNPKAVRASAGSLFRLPLVAGVTDADARAALGGVAAYAADARGEMALPEADLRRPCALIIGSEGRGVRPALRSAAAGLRIPTSGVESLNAAAAAAILLYEARRQRMTV